MRKFLLCGLGVIIAFMCAANLFTVYKNDGRIDAADLLLIATVYTPIVAFFAAMIVIGLAIAQRRAIGYWEQRAERHHERHLRRRHGSPAPTAENEGDLKGDSQSESQANDTHLPDTQ